MLFHEEGRPRAVLAYTGKALRRRCRAFRLHIGEHAAQRLLGARSRELRLRQLRLTRMISQAKKNVCQAKKATTPSSFPVQYVGWRCTTRGGARYDTRHPLPVEDERCVVRFNVPRESAVVASRGHVQTSAGSGGTAEKRLALNNEWRLQTFISQARRRRDEPQPRAAAVDEPRRRRRVCVGIIRVAARRRGNPQPWSPSPHPRATKSVHERYD